KYFTLSGLRMGYYVYKLNIQPNILQTYIKNNEFDYLVTQEIPTVLENIAEVQRVGTFYMIDIINKSTDDFFLLFNKLENMTHELLEEYNKVLFRYKKEEEVFYPKKFLKLNEKCMDLRRDIEFRYPGIKRSFDVISDESVEALFGIETDNQVGTGITHIRKFYKMKEFISTSKGKDSLEPLKLTSFYNSKTEHILVESDDVEMSINYINALENVINTTKDITSRIGKINLNPIYESIDLDGEYSEISYTLVYPNGNPPMERDSILKESQAKEIQSKIIGTDGKPLIIEPVKEMLENEAKKGYLKTLKVKGREFISSIKFLNNKETDS
ncbi:hypothetical protein, partial [Vagococcus fluvialis]